jgi:hypothetical protein
MACKDDEPAGTARLDRTDLPVLLVNAALVGVPAAYAMSRSVQIAGLSIILAVLLAVVYFGFRAFERARHQPETE